MYKARILGIVLLALAILWGCSRKSDESLPPRTGDLIVRFTIHDESDELDDPSNIPVIVSIYLDTLHTNMIASESVTAKEDTPSQVQFEEVVTNFYWLEVLVNEAGLPPQCPDTRVFVQQNLTTTTDILEFTIRQDFWLCPGLAP